MNHDLTRRGLLAGIAAGAVAPLPAIADAVAPLPAIAGAVAQSPATSAPSLRAWTIWPLLAADPAASLDAKVRAKPVHAHEPMPGATDPAAWHASAAGRIRIVSDDAAGPFLRLTAEQRNPDYLRAARQPNGSFTGQGVLFDGTPWSVGAQLHFPAPRDWRGFNRISLRCRQHPNGNPAVSLALQFLCEGATAGPTDPIATHYVTGLSPGAWTELTWEIPEMQRDRVVAFSLFVPISGLPFPDGDPRLTLDFDRLRLDRVDCEQVSGWQVAPGHLAYSHIGYPRDAPKQAVLGATPGGAFTLRDADSGEIHLHAPITLCTTRLGSYGVADFSAVTRPGRYVLATPEATSAPFPIGDPWPDLAAAILNGFYGLRCGVAVPGAHAACHQDVRVRYQGQMRTVAGGWHDAANLTQGPGRTHLSIYALFELHDALRVSSPACSARAREEALWGLDWSLRMRFGPGLRCLYGTASYFTDGRIGTLDDVIQDNVGTDRFQTILAVLATARAARALHDDEPALAARALAAAEADFPTIGAGATIPPTDAPPIGLNEGCWRDQVGYWTLAAIELFRVTGKPDYAAEAIRLGRMLVALQERRFIDGAPITGYFYEDAGRTRIVHEFHHSFEESGLTAMRALCDAFPDAPDWPDWHAGLVLYSEYFCRRGAAYAAPFDLLPAAVWRRQDLTAAAPPDRAGAMLARHPNPIMPTFPTPTLIATQMQAEFDAGVPLAPDQRLRLFPLWFDHVRHGSSVVQLSKAAALAACAAARSRPDLSLLAARQMQWVVGANPLTRSLITGVGQDWWQNFSGSLPNFVGAMSLGMNCYADDSPAWGNNAVFPYKEQWVFASCRLALLLAAITAPARLTLESRSAGTITALDSGAARPFAPGTSTHRLVPGRYRITGAGRTREILVTPGGDQTLEFRPDRWITITLAAAPAPDGTMTLTAALDGHGRHDLRLRLFNATSLDQPSELPITLSGPARRVWRLGAGDRAQPFVATLIANRDSAGLAECFGTWPA